MNTMVNKQSKSFWAVLMMACTLCATAWASPKASADGQEELRAVWIATIGGIDWPGTYATSPQTIDRQKQEFTEMLDRLRLIGINTVLLQTRVRATTIYPSVLEPWDGCMSGKPGTSPGYDPLAFAIEECHRRGMQLQAWVVTIPVGKWNAAGCARLRKKYPNAVVKIGADGYLRPDHPQTADIISSVCAEIVSNYDVDGIHLDYIRYPENWKQKLNKAEGRRNITNIVSRIHSTVKSIRPDIILSCSPLGKYNDLTGYSSRGWNCYNTVCQDAQAWLRDGLMDQLYPMLYFRDNNFYPFAIDWAENGRGSVAAGLAAYCLDRREGNWPLSELVRQLNVCRQIGLGQCFFRAKFLLDNTKGIYDFLRLFNHDAPVLCNDYRVFFSREYDSRCYDSPGDEARGTRYENGNEAQDAYPSAITSFNSYTTTTNYLRSTLLPNDGKTLRIPHSTDAELVVVESLAGNALTTLRVSHDAIDISALPEGVFTLRSLHRKGINHRIGMFRVKRH